MIGHLLILKWALGACTPTKDMVWGEISSFCGTEMMWRDLIDFAVLPKPDSIAAVSPGHTECKCPSGGVRWEAGLFGHTASLCAPRAVMQ